MRDIRAAPSVSHPSIWLSPVPYLLGAVGSMIALIFIALIILVCSHWRNPSTSSQDDSNNTSDSNLGEINEGMKKKVLYCSEDNKSDKVIVIMAGEVMPTFIAMPITLQKPAT
ncbi:hypothetical protein SUGI_0894940 [Cryptomeria japonica]|uniref:protein GLUTAMINE DUMPER 4-like n=1 Tax=Cryptomeria japonica TaxID=3369 RepID=UPI002414CAAD|nr:protein GLUTAMINE DUMPER 4-like [Cryptomeria japonica]GLJ43126.1 hypothetical protein SUGI_0894940 [Cryptomeria japonica]